MPVHIIESAIAYVLPRCCPKHAIMAQEEVFTRFSKNNQKAPRTPIPIKCRRQLRIRGPTTELRSATEEQSLRSVTREICNQQILKKRLTVGTCV